MPQVGFRPTTPVFEWAEIIHALDRAATVIGVCIRRVSMTSFPMYLLWKRALIYPHISVIFI
jgi:hypothetical protein